MLELQARRYDYHKGRVFYFHIFSLYKYNNLEENNTNTQTSQNKQNNGLYPDSLPRIRFLQDVLKINVPSRLIPAKAHIAPFNCCYGSTKILKNINPCKSFNRKLRIT